MLRSTEVILFCCCNYRLYIFNPHLRRFPRLLKILPSPAIAAKQRRRASAGLILKAQYKNQKEKEMRGTHRVPHSALFLRSDSSSFTFLSALFLFLFLFFRDSRSFFRFLFFKKRKALSAPLYQNRTTSIRPAPNKAINQPVMKGPLF